MSSKIQMTDSRDFLKLNVGSFSLSRILILAFSFTVTELTSLLCNPRRTNHCAMTSHLIAFSKNTELAGSYWVTVKNTKCHTTEQAL